jgi:hypothetical protein
MAKLKAPPDPRGGHVRLHWEILDSRAWLALDWLDQGLYVALRRKLRASNNGNIEATLKTMRHAGFKSSASLAKGLRALQAVGLIEKTRQGGIANGGKECSLYRFTDEDTWEHAKQGIKAMKATNDWRQFATIAQAEAAVRAAHGAAKRPVPSVKSKVQHLKRADSASERIGQFSDSTIEHSEVGPLQLLNTSCEPQIGRRAA